MDNLIYEDNPWTYWRLPFLERQRIYKTSAAWTRGLPWSVHSTPVVFIIVFTGMLVAFTLPSTMSLGIFVATVFLVGIAVTAINPTKYQIFNDKIRIVLGFVLHFDIPFSSVENLSAATFQDLLGLNLNFINSYGSDDILRITRKRGAKIYITPNDRNLFLEHLNKALTDWKGH